MNWNERFARGNRPGLDAVGAHIGSPLWENLRAHLEETYLVEPHIEHSGCSAAPGWNVKYKKGGRSLATIYPHEGYFTSLVTLGTREAPEAELALGTCGEYIQELCRRTTPCNGSRWLMIDVKSEEILEDVKRLIRVRAGRK